MSTITKDILPKIVNVPVRECPCPACGAILPRGELAVVRGGNGIHDTYATTCACGSTWYVEDRSRHDGPPLNRWIIDHKTQRVLVGVASCCGGSYLCKCGGVVSRRFVKRNGEPTDWCMWGPNGKEHRAIWSCDGCGFEIETEDDDYRPEGA